MLESLELGSIIPYRLIHTYRAEWALFSDFLYFALTTLRGQQTLGEQYCAIGPVSRSTGHFPSVLTRVEYFIMTALGPYYLSKFVRQWQQPLQQMAFDAAAAADEEEEDEQSKPDLREILKKIIL